LILKPLVDLEKGSEAEEVEISQNSFMETIIKKDLSKDYLVNSCKSRWLATSN